MYASAVGGVAGRVTGPHRWSTTAGVQPAGRPAGRAPSLPGASWRFQTRAFPDEDVSRRGCLQTRMPGAAVGGDETARTGSNGKVGRHGPTAAATLGTTT